MATLLGLLVLVIVMGLVYWLIGYLPIPEPFNKIIMVIMILILIVYVLALAGFVALPVGGFR